MLLSLLSYGLTLLNLTVRTGFNKSPDMVVHCTPPSSCLKHIAETSVRQMTIFPMQSLHEVSSQFELDVRTGPPRSIEPCDTVQLEFVCFFNHPFLQSNVAGKLLIYQKVVKQWNIIFIPPHHNRIAIIWTSTQHIGHSRQTAQSILIERLYFWNSSTHPQSLFDGFLIVFMDFSKS
jgi:hypothetical protein